MATVWLAGVLSGLLGPGLAAEPLRGVRTLPGNMPQLSVIAPPPSRFEPAPTPDLDAKAPSERSSNEPRLRATLTRRAQGFGAQGDGFSRGSSYSGYFDRRGRATDGIGTTLAPSLQLRVPLD